MEGCSDLQRLMRTALSERDTEHDRSRALRILQAIVDNLVDSIVTIDQNGVICAVSRPAELLFGYTTEEMLGQPVSLLMPEPDASQHQEYVDRYLLTREAKIIGIGREVVARRKDGTLFSADLAVSELAFDGQRLFTGTLRDISKRKRAEEALRETEHRLQELQLQHTELERAAVAGEMAAVVAHEVRTPLNALAINLQMVERLLRRDKLSRRKRVESLIATMHQEVERINALVEDYLRIVRRPGRPTESVSVENVVDEAVSFIELQASKASVELVRHSADPLPEITTAPAKLRQCLLNLLLNALQAMPDGGRVDVTTTSVDNGVEVVVADDGPGIPEDQLEKIFRPFHTTKANGTGLGLAITDRIVRKLGGKLSVKSSEGSGARFTIWLPTTADQS